MPSLVAVAEGRYTDVAVIAGELVSSAAEVALAAIEPLTEGWVTK